MNIKSIINRYKENSSKLADIKVENKAKKMISAFILALFLISAPLIVTINLFVFYDYYMLLVFIIAVIIDALYFLTKKFYYEQIKNENEEALADIDMELLYIIEQIMLALVLIATCFIVYSIVGW